MSPLIDFTSHRFGRLVVIQRAAPGTDKRQKVRWLCQCDCGNTAIALAELLRNGSTQSCGCLHSEILRKRNLTHGDSHTPEYKAWRQIIQRCENPKNPDYENYGDRGIRVCPRWRHGEDDQPGYDCFLWDMGRRPSPEYSIDRINNDGHYEPNNCRWATDEQQRQNKRPRSKFPERGSNGRYTK